MSKPFQFTPPSEDLRNEIEQYIWGKYGTTPPKAIGQMVLAQMSKNPLTTQQYNRIVRKYGDNTVISLEPLSGTPER